jgi:tetratricopeptide (TPR) repeat protein
MNTLNKLNIKKEIVNYLGMINARNHTEVDRYAPILIDFLEQSDDCKELLLFVKGMTNHSRTQFNEAKYFFEQGLALKPQNDELTGILHMGLGFTQRSLGNLDEAVSNIFIATELIAPEGDFKFGMENCYHQLGEIHVTIDEYEKAIGYFNKALQIAEKKSEGNRKFRIHNSLGVCYLHMKEYDKSKEHLTIALDVENLTPAIISKGKHDLGTLHIELKEYTEAEKLLVDSLNIRREHTLEDASSTSMVALAEVYIEQKRIPEAIELLIESKLIIEKYNTKWKNIKVLLLLARAYAANNQFEQSNAYYEQYNTLQNEVKTEQERKIFKLLNEQIEKQKQVISDKHNQLIETFAEIKRLKINRKAVFFSWITVIVLVIISEIFIDPFIDQHAYNTLWSLLVKVFIALLFKPLDGMYENILWNKTINKVD